MKQLLEQVHPVNIQITELKSEETLRRKNIQILVVIITSFNRKISLLTSNIELKKKLVRCYVWSIALYGSETWPLRILERKYLESFEMWRWRRMENINTFLSTHSYAPMFLIGSAQLSKIKFAITIKVNKLEKIFKEEKNIFLWVI